MGRLIRKCIFETNSSSTHSLTMCSGDVYHGWENGDFLYWEDCDKFIKNTPEELDLHYRKCLINNGIEYNWDEKTMTYKTVTVPYNYKTWGEDAEVFYTPENLNEFTEEEVKKFVECELGDEQSLLSYGEYEDKHGEYYEMFEDTYITKNGEEVVAFGYYGYD